MEQVRYQINVNKAVKEAIEKIVGRGTVEEEWEQTLISTAAELRQLLFNRTTDGEWAKQAQALQSEVGLFLPSLTQAIFEWMKEGKESIIEEIKVLATRSSK